MGLDKLKYINWHEMIKPENIVVEGTSNYGKFVCQPLERGFGITLGNTLRRVLLSSLYGAAIVSVKIDSVVHEFSVIDGVVEDLSEIILNLKQIRFKPLVSLPMIVHIDASGEGVVTAASITVEDGQCEVLNTEQHIATLSSQGALRMTMTVEVGKGYSLSEANLDADASLGTIPIDAVFSPVKRVTYVVADARVGQKTDYDKLTIEVWTDGSITPDDAVAYSAKIIKEQMSIFINFDERVVCPELKEEPEEIPKQEFNKNLYRSVGDLELSVRSANCLRNADIFSLHELVSKTEAEMLQTKNFGRKSLNEIKDVLNEMDLSLGMDIEGFVPYEEDVEEGE